MILFVIIFVIIWLFCGFLAYGMVFADLQGQFPNDEYFTRECRHSDQMMAKLFGFFGPIGLISAVIITDWMKHGLKWK